jgi:hypothetical protein
MVEPLLIYGVATLASAGARSVLGLEDDYGLSNVAGHAFHEAVVEGQGVEARGLKGGPGTQLGHARLGNFGGKPLGLGAVAAQDGSRLTPKERKT